MTKTYILGSGYLSKNLKLKIPNSRIFTIDKFTKLKLTNKNKYNLIINSFLCKTTLNVHLCFISKTKDPNTTIIFNNIKEL